jgi:signal transduction histidine kinase/CheY-like chemotaxis protein
MTVQPPSPTSESAPSRSQALFAEHEQNIFRRTDRMFVWLMIAQWVAGIVIALVVSPRTWVGTESQTHPHVWAAIFLGGIFSSLPVFLAFRSPGSVLTRHAIAVSQMLTSSLLIHLTGGRIETHFHVFGSLAFLAFYRDWRVLVTATLVTAVDHVVRGMYFPQSVYGLATVDNWRWLEHAAWVLFEDVFLAISIFQSRREMRDLAQRQELVIASELAKQARDVAIESARLKSRFLANMSHEIRTPMNGVIGMTHLLMDTGLTEQQRDYTETIKSSGEALLAIINDILDFSKVEAGKLTFEVLDFDLYETVEGTLELLAEKAQANQLELAGFIEPNVPVHLRGDSGRLRQVLTNLVGNALKFTEKGEVSLRVSLESETEKEACLRFAIRDTGIGLTPEGKARLFVPFHQADLSTTRKFGGTGLGLAISRQLVEKMHGEIGVESVAGEGSTFWFTVRLQKQAEAVAHPNAGHPLENTRVLIVDDNETSGSFLHEQIVAWNFRNGTAVTGADALARLHAAQAEGDPYPLAVLDLRMPQMDGLTLARAIKADPKISDTRLILLTDFGQRIPDEELQAAGIAACRFKPVRQSSLYDCFAGVLADAPARPRPLAAPAPALPQGRPGLRILLADDNPVNQKVAVCQLRKLGYEADAVADGLEVLEALNRIPYDIVFMDCQMPQLDGYEATAAIRQREGDRRHTWIIAMTANAMTGDRELCLAAGMDDYVSKPVRSAELATVLERARITPVGADAKTPAVDKESLDALRALPGDEGGDLLGELITLLVAHGPALLSSMESALERKDAHGLAEAAHSLKGSCAQFGAQRLVKLCAQLEAAGREALFEGARETLSTTEQEFHRVIAELKSLPTPSIL